MPRSNEFASERFEGLLRRSRGRAVGRAHVRTYRGGEVGGCGHCKRNHDRPTPMAVVPKSGRANGLQRAWPLDIGHYWR